MERVGYSVGSSLHFILLLLILIPIIIIIIIITVVMYVVLDIFTEYPVLKFITDNFTGSAI